MTLPRSTTYAVIADFSNTTDGREDLRYLEEANVSDSPGQKILEDDVIKLVKGNCWLIEFVCALQLMKATVKGDAEPPSFRNSQ